MLQYYNGKLSDLIIMSDDNIYYKLKSSDAYKKSKDILSEEQQVKDLTITQSFDFFSKKIRPGELKNKVSLKAVIIYKGRPSFFYYSKQISLISFLSLISIILLYNNIDIGVWTFLGSILLSISLFIEHQYDYFEVTARRIRHESGFFLRKSTEVSFSDIKNIDVHSSIIKNSFGVGTIEIVASGDKPEIILKDIYKAQRLRELLQRFQDDYHK